MGNNDWEIGDTCVMFTNKAKGYTAEYTVQSFDGKYYGIRRGSYYHRVSPSRIFHSREEALASLTVDSPEEAHSNDEESVMDIQMGGM